MMMLIGGWTRLWIVVITLYAVMVSLFSYATRPQLTHIQSEWIYAAANVIAEKISEKEGRDIPAYKVQANLLKDKNTDQSIAWLEKVAEAPSEPQKVFSSEIVKLNKHHRALISSLASEQLQYIMISFVSWLGPSIVLFILGWVVGWVVRGFGAKAF